MTLPNNMDPVIVTISIVGGALAIMASLFVTLYLIKVEKRRAFFSLMVGFACFVSLLLFLYIIYAAFVFMGLVFLWFWYR